MPSSSTTEQIILNSISQNSSDRIRLLHFEKIDATQSELMGVKMYAMEISLDIEFTKDCKWLVGGLGQQLTLATAPETGPQGGSTAQFLEQLANPGIFVKKGQRYRITGVERFARKESGWSPVGLELQNAILLAGQVADVQNSRNPNSAEKVAAEPKSEIVDAKSLAGLWIAVVDAKTLENHPERRDEPNIINFEADGRITYGLDGRLEVDAVPSLNLVTNYRPEKWTMAPDNHIILKSRNTNAGTFRVVQRESTMIFNSEWEGPAEGQVFTRLMPSDLTPITKTRIAETSEKWTIIYNLRQLSAATEQFCMEHAVSTANYEQLALYIKKIQPVAGEDYAHLEFRNGKPLSVRTSSGKVITYTP